MTTTVPTIDTLIARRVTKGARADESRILLEQLLAAHSADNLATALVYEDFATELQAYAFIAALHAPAPVEPRLEQRCHCGAQLTWWRGDGDLACDRCGTWYNAFGQRLRDDWAGNGSCYDDELSDLDGYELQHAHAQ